MVHSPWLTFRTVEGWSGLANRPAVIEPCAPWIRPLARWPERPANPRWHVRSRLQTCGCSPYIVKLEGLLEMRGLARLNLRRKRNRLRSLHCNGQNARCC